ncbi:MAG: hypothetical protein WC443_08835 [Desulfobaccales bacterium]
MQNRILKIVPLLAAVAVILLPGLALADLIGPEDFSAQAAIEGFEGISPATANTGALEFGNFFAIGTQTSYTFNSGVTLTNPCPALPVANGGPYIEDFNYSGGVNTWGANGTANQAPFGKSYLGFYNETAYVEFTFDQPMYRVGAYVTGAPGTVRLEAYHNADLIASTSVATVPVAAWSSNFIGIASDGITKVILRGADVGIDNLTYEPAPVPPTLILFGSGLLGLWGVCRGRRQS